MALANALLFVGSNKTPCDCDFPLQFVLIVGGVLGLVIGFMDALKQFIVSWIAEDSIINRVENGVIIGWKILGWFLTSVQIVSFVFGSILVFRAYPYVHYKRSEICDPGSQKYKKLMPELGPNLFCDYSLFTFSFALMVMIWIFLIKCFLSFAYIYYGIRRRQMNQDSV